MAQDPFAARQTSIWIDGFFYWVIRGFKGRFAEQIAAQYDKRNFWTGYVITIIGIMGIVYVIFFRDL